PTFVFVNKMDQPGTDADNIMTQLTKEFGTGFVKFEDSKPADVEELAACDEAMMEEFFETESVSKEKVVAGISQRKVFPVCFGSALKIEGVDELLKTVEDYTGSKEYPEEFSARVYKISRDKQGNRQTHLKITGGTLKNKMIIKGDGWEEKVEQIRLYNGKTFEAAQDAEAGMICSVHGLTRTYAGQALGDGAEGDQLPMIAPALTYQLILPAGVDSTTAMQKFRQLEEEDPSLNIIWNEKLQEIHVQVMGKLELEILQHIIKDRFDIEVSFGNGSVIYKETIEEPVIGIGHFEPLRHYAEAHILLEPLPRGTGIITDAMVSEDKLAKNWQRLIMGHLSEKEHIGVLTGSPISDIKMTIIAGKAHLKHTEGGDFRQATYRAIRQGLMKAKSILLEPVYSFRIEVPNENVGRVLSDMQKLGASPGLPEMKDQETSVVEGTGPVATLQDYQQEVLAYTKGKGRFTAVFAGYDKCHNAEEVIARIGYNPDSDLDNQTGSIFCSHGSGDYVPWDEVDEMAHVESGYSLSEEGVLEKVVQPMQAPRQGSYMSASNKELEEIFRRTYGESKRDEALRRAQASRRTHGGKQPETPLPKLIKTDSKSFPEYIIVDGYNVIFAWDEMRELVEKNIDSAREAFIEILQNYQAYKKVGMVVVFDGYKVAGNVGTKQKFGDLEVVYTKEAETADRFIEKTAYEMGRKYDIKVVTSDRPVQMAALGDGAMRMSAREFFAEVMNTSEEIRAKLGKQKASKNRPFEDVF
ncbi:MAG: TetM/TetW/TetO/TetS family tetracycline resistance ribosomal protection protein, partial [Firmicutes bacterium]|nr:TetM/TetW/TetO/TetS family tetracycline resistance ribosomal protection protein [Bacillota bacterium]